MLKLRSLVLSLSIALLIILSKGGMEKSENLAQATAPDLVVHRQAQTLTEKGHQQLNQGQPDQALASWSEATKIYQKLHNQEGIAGSLINQSLAFQDLGLNLRACSTLLSALKLDSELYSWLCNSSLSQVPEEPLKVLGVAVEQSAPLPVNIIGLQNLGDVLRLFGKADESELVLQKALTLANRLIPLTDLSTIRLSLANTARLSFNQLKNKYSNTENPIIKYTELNLIQHQALLTLKLYQKLNIDKNTPLPIRLKSQLSCLGLLLDANKWAAAQIESGQTELVSFQDQIQNQIQTLVTLLQQNSLAFSQLPASQSVLAQLNFATSLAQIPNERLQPVAIQYAQSALQTATRLGSLRLESNSLGVLGNLYEQTERSQFYLEKASSLADAVRAWDLAWQWQSQLARLYQKQFEYQKATQAYEAAIGNLERVQGNILSSNPDVQFSFREKVEPIYREYMRLLLSEPTPNLETVIQINERLQLAELENFLQCGQLDLISLDKIQNTTNLPTIVHIIDLGNRVDVIVRSSDRILHHYAPNVELVKSNTYNLLNNLQDAKLDRIDKSAILSYSQQLYRLLLATAKNNGYLPEAGTLIFVLDTSLQNIPMSILHDGQNYLVEKYSISVALGSQMPRPKPLRQGELKALIAGLSERSPSFKDPHAPQNLTPLPEVVNEVKNVRASVNSNLELLNNQFTSKRFGTEMSQYDFPIVHVSTHGQFSSDPRETVLLAWDKPINLQQINGLLRSKIQNSQDTIELLVLSACQTAKGDTRSALGIAGVATQAGARSTVATLWVVDAKSTALLMGEFYKGLKIGMSKAEALQQSQLALLKSHEFSHPYYWAPFLLVGSWL